VGKDGFMTEPFAPGAPNWIDLGTTDVKGAAEFYGALFGWTHEDLGPDAGGYGMLRLNGKVVAGIGPATDPDRGTSWATYFATADARATARKVESHGGKVIVEPMEVFDNGSMAVFTDPHGAYFSVWQPANMRGLEVIREPGSLSWVELMTPEVETSKSFYQDVLGVTMRDIHIDGELTYTLVQADGVPVAGIFKIGPELGDMPPHWSVYLEVDDCDATADQAIGRGATEMVRQDSPAGRFAMLTDPQGGNFSIIKTDPDYTP
jgi:predicted enzyme related to lactoylglutathione lyase